jgi:hypothetical protein
LFQIQDDNTNMPIDVTLIRRAGSGGNLNLGDQVEVWGRPSGGYAVQALRVRVYETGGQSTDYTIRARRLWPTWVGWAVLGGVLFLLLYFTIRLWPIRNMGLGDFLQDLF